MIAARRGVLAPDGPGVQRGLRILGRNAGPLPLPRDEHRAAGMPVRAHAPTSCSSLPLILWRPGDRPDFPRVRWAHGFASPPHDGFALVEMRGSLCTVSEAPG